VLTPIEQPSPGLLWEPECDFFDLQCIFCYIIYSRSTLWWSLARKPQRSQVEGVSWPKPITSVFLLPQKSHEYGFIFILRHKNYRKTTFNSGIPHAKFAMTSRWRYADITSTCPTIRMTSLRIPDDTDATEEIRIHICCIWYLYTTPGYHGSIAGLHGSNFVIFLRNISSWR
jgi:hypothetical protein